MGLQLGTDLSDPNTIPWFLWDEPMRVADVRRVLAEGSESARRRLLARILREARDTEVWAFTTPQEVQREWDLLAPMLGRRRAFWAWLLSQWKEQGLLDSPSASGPERPVVNGIVIDDAREILANKLCALLGRMELRDLVDTQALLDSGLELEAALARAMEKDGGLTPAQLAWVLSQMPIAEDETPPGGAQPADLRSFSTALQQRLLSLAYP